MLLACSGSTATPGMRRCTRCTVSTPTANPDRRTPVHAPVRSWPAPARTRVLVPDMYELPESLLVANPLNRYLINSPMLDSLQLDPDGGLTLHLQHESPDPASSPTGSRPEWTIHDSPPPVLATAEGDQPPLDRAPLQRCRAAGASRPNKLEVRASKRTDMPLPGCSAVRVRPLCPRIAGGRLLH